MVLDVIVMLLVGFFALRGRFTGIWHVVFATAGLVSGYAAALFLGRPAGDLLAAMAQWPPTGALVAASLGLFAAGNLFWKLIAAWTARRRRRKGLDALTGWERVLGLGAGGLEGAVLGVLVVWLSTFVPTGEPMFEGLDLESSAARRILAPVSETLTVLAGRVLTGDPDSGLVLSRTLENPREVQEGLQSMLTSPAARALLDDERLQAEIAAGRAGDLRENPRFRAFMESPETSRLIETLGRGESHVEVERGVENLLARSYRVAANLKNDEGLRSALADPELQRLLQERNVAGLLKDPRVRQLLERYGSELPD